MKKILILFMFLPLFSNCQDSLRYFLLSYETRDTIETKTFVKTKYGSTENSYYKSYRGHITFEINTKEQAFFGATRLDNYIKKTHQEIPKTSSIIITFIYEFKNRKEYEYYDSN